MTSSSESEGTSIQVCGCGCGVGRARVTRDGAEIVGGEDTGVRMDGAMAGALDFRNV
jgi:hypothetical protein